MTRFGLKSLFGSISPIDTLRLDQAVVGLLLTPVALGFYVVAQASRTFPGSSPTASEWSPIRKSPRTGPGRRAPGLMEVLLHRRRFSALVVGALWFAAGQIVTRLSSAASSARRRPLLESCSSAVSSWPPGAFSPMG